MQVRHRGGGGFSALCLDSDKGIFKFLEISVEASQFYFHPRINHVFPWPLHTSAGKGSDRVAQFRSEGR